MPNTGGEEYLNLFSFMVVEAGLGQE